MKPINFLRRMVLSVVPVACAVSLMPFPAAAQQSAGSMGAHLQSAVYDGSTQSGWYSYPGQQPKLRFSGNDVRITSRKASMVMLSRGVDASGSAAEVWLTRAPISTSSISGLGVLGDTQHAMVIGLAGGNVVLWQLDPAATRIVASQPVNATSPLEFRVTGGDAAEVRFFWRHRGDTAWHALGNSASNKALASWREPMHFGLLLDGPRGSQVTFSNYRAASTNEASITATAMLAEAQ